LETVHVNEVPSCRNSVTEEDRNGCWAKLVSVSLLSEKYLYSHEDCVERLDNMMLLLVLDLSAGESDPAFVLLLFRTLDKRIGMKKGVNYPCRSLKANLCSIEESESFSR
jgi:hypothetical protein